MSIYVIVDEAYYTTVFRTQKALRTWAAQGRWCDEHGDRIDLTSSDVVEALKQGRAVRLYEHGASDWTYKLERHD